MSFSDLGLSEPILRAVAAAGYESPTEIQRRAIPLARQGQDLIALGQTGSGKTAAFGLPMLERLLGGEPGLRALILVPTRELCVQVAESLRAYAAETDLAVRTAFGGIPITVQESAFRRGVDVLVACPGRLLDHLQIGTIDLDRVEMLVLDEADRMLDMGFLPQIGRILARLPQQRQNWLFSATMPAEVERLVRDHFGATHRVQVGQRSEAAATITHCFESVPESAKVERLQQILRGAKGSVLVFVKRKTRAEELGRQLKRAGLPADSIHGDKGAEARHVVLQAFSRGRVRFLVATDVAARGIDVSDIGLVVNFDFPRAVEDYVHRVGRTGRAGTEGSALSLVASSERGVQRQVIEHLRATSNGRSRIVIDGRGDAPAQATAERTDERRRRTPRDRRSPERTARRRDDRVVCEVVQERPEGRRKDRRAATSEVDLSVDLDTAASRGRDADDVVW